MFSDALREMDRNTERYMVEELNKQVEDLKAELNTTIAEKDAALIQKDSELIKRNSELADMRSLVQGLTKELTQYKQEASTSHTK